MRKISQRHIKRERDPQKIKRVLILKGYKSGKLPSDKELHHVKPVAEGGKTTKGNIRIVSRAKHQRIHENRKKRGQI